MLASILVIALSLGAPGKAQTIKQLADGAEQVVTGTVMATSAKLETTESGDQLIITRARVVVAKTHKGQPFSTIEVDVEGGTLDGITMGVSDMPVMKPGDRHLFLLKKNKRGRWVPYERGNGILPESAEEGLR